MLLRELRAAARGLARRPGLSAAAIVTLALGIGASCALVGIINGILWRPLPAAQPGQLVVLAFQQKGESGSQATDVFSPADVNDLRAPTRNIFTGVVGYTPSLDGLSYHQRAERAMVTYCGSGYFQLLGLRPAAGRLLQPGEGIVPGRDPVIVLGFNYWQTRFGSDRAIVGQTISVDGHPFTVVGVAPRGFGGTTNLAESAAYIPLAMAEVTEGYAFLPTFMTDRTQRALSILARRRPGVSLERAQAELNLVAARLAASYPKTDKHFAVAAYNEVDARPGPDPNYTFQKISALFLSLGGLLLLLACANVANLLLVRATGRSQELAVRAAMGAGRWKLLRPMLLESLLLSLAGGAGGLLLAVWACARLANFNWHTSLPIRLNFAPDYRVYLAALLVTLVSALAAGFLPAWRASRLQLSTALQSGGRSLSGVRSRLRSSLVVAQVAGSLALLIVAGLFVRGLGQAQRARLGFDPAQVMNFSLDPNTIGMDQARGQTFYRDLLRRVRALPGVEAASTEFSVPMGYLAFGDHVLVPGYTPPPGAPSSSVQLDNISTGLFTTLRIPILRGRDFLDSDDTHAEPAAVVNEAFVRKYWPNQDPLGRTFTIASDSAQTWHVVGIAGNVQRAIFQGAPQPLAYLPLEQNYISMQTLQVRTRGRAAAIAPSIEALIASMAPGLPISEVQSQTEAMDGLNGFLIYQLGAGLAAVLGLLGLGLAVIGVYGVISFSTAQRTHEIGLRMALGANRGGVLGLVLRQGGLLVGAGAALGALAALGLGRVVAGFLPGVNGADPLTFLLVTALLVAAGLLACLLPGLRATRVDPATALRLD